MPNSTNHCLGHSFGLSPLKAMVLAHLLGVPVLEATLFCWVSEKRRPHAANIPPPNHKPQHPPQTHPTFSNIPPPNPPPPNPPKIPPRPLKPTALLANLPQGPRRAGGGGGQRGRGQRQVLRRGTGRWLRKRWDPLGDERKNRSHLGWGGAGWGGPCELGEFMGESIGVLEKSMCILFSGKWMAHNPSKPVEPI